MDEKMLDESCNIAKIIYCTRMINVNKSHPSRTREDVMRLKRKCDGAVKMISYPVDIFTSTLYFLIEGEKTLLTNRQADIACYLNSGF